MLPVEIIFQDWLDQKAFRADAFLDPGADHTMISLRWLHEQANAVDAKVREPMMDPSGFLLEKVELSIGGQRMAVGDDERHVWIGSQEEPERDSLPEMPGLEDMLLGRDFVTQHGLLILIDGDQSRISLLAPVDAENRQRRDQILAAFDDAQTSS